MHVSSWVKGLVVCGLLAGNAWAGNDITYLPTDGTPDTADPLGVAGDAAPGFGTGSFQANGAAKTAIYFNMEQLFGAGTNVTVGQLGTISFWTKQSAVPSDPGTYLNWYLEVYTKADGVDDDSWYGRRLNFEPYFSPDLSDANAPADTWVKWTTNVNDSNTLRVFDANRGAAGLVFGTYTDPYLEDLQAAPINWNDFSSAYENASVDYRGEEIWYMGISTGSGWANSFSGQVDGVTVSLADGNTGTLNFEAAPVVPAPGAIFAGPVLLGLVGLRRKRR